MTQAKTSGDILIVHEDGAHHFLTFAEARSSYPHISALDLDSSGACQVYGIAPNVSCSSVSCAGPCLLNSSTSEGITTYWCNC